MSVDLGYIITKKEEEEITNNVLATIGIKQVFIDVTQHYKERLLILRPLEVKEQGLNALLKDPSACDTLRMVGSLANSGR